MEMMQSQMELGKESAEELHRTRVDHLSDEVKDKDQRIHEMTQEIEMAHRKVEEMKGEIEVLGQ